MGLKETSKIGSYFSAANAPGMLMSYAELLFIKAEAAKRNFIPGGDEAAEIAFMRASGHHGNSSMQAALLLKY
jgi:hypothetical protein